MAGAGKPPARRSRSGLRAGLAAAARPALELVFLEHVANGVLLDEQVRAGVPVELERALVVPLDPAAQLLPVVEDQYHRRLRRHLLEVIELLGVGLLGRRLLAAHAARRQRVLELVHVRADQLAVGHVDFRVSRRPRKAAAGSAAATTAAGSPGSWSCIDRLRRPGSTAACRTGRRSSTD